MLQISRAILEKIDENTVVVKKQKGSLGARDAILEAVRGDQNLLLGLSRRAYGEIINQIMGVLVSLV